jgi:ABC-type nitrate/sulfonate/bicarbonate transport system permease component
VTGALCARGRRALLPLAFLGAALGIWEVTARSRGSFLLPPFSEVARRAWEVWPTQDFLTSVAASLERLGAGYAIGATIGIALGLLMGSSRGTRRALEPLTELARATPPIAVVPAAVVILGLGSGMRVAVIAFGVCFPVLVNTIDGVCAAPPETRDTATMLHVGRVRRVLGVYLPAGLPSIVAGLRVALSIGLVMMVISEFVGGGDGIGVYIRFQESQFNVTELYGGILFLGLLGYVLNRFFLAAERHALSWHYGAVGEPAR